MRLALVRQRYNPYGGAERFVERAIEALGSQDVEVTLIAREWSGEGRWPVLRCDPFHLGRVWRDASFAACVRRAAAREHFDLVQSHERIPGCDIYRAGDGVHATWLALRARGQPPLVRAAVRLSPWHRYTLAAEGRLFRHPALRAVICNSRLVREDIAARFGVAADKLHVVYSGVDGERFHPGLANEHRAALRTGLGVGMEVPVILYVGSGFERKGVASLIQALARLPGSAELWIVGADRRERRYRDMARRLRIDHRVRFAGAQRDVRPWLGAADAFALPSLYDPLPNAALEALASGLPVLTSRTSGAAELIEDGASGYLVDAGDLTAIAAAMARLVAPGRATAMRDQARAAVAHLTPEAMAGRLAALYRDLLAPPGSGSPPPL